MESVRHALKTVHVYFSSITLTQQTKRSAIRAVYNCQYIIFVL